MQDVQVKDFQNHLREHYERCAQGDVLSNWRSRAWDHFLELGLPSRKNETYRYLPLRDFYENEFQPTCFEEVEHKQWVFPECAQSHIVFVNGIFSASMSDISALSHSVVLLSITDAMKSYGIFLQNRLAKLLQEEIDPFATINGALQTSGAFLYIPPKVSVDVPLQILHIVTTEKAICLSPRLHLFAGSESKIHCYEQMVTTKSSNFWFNGVSDFSLEENAHVHLHSLHLDLENAWVFDALRATLKRDSSLQTIHYTSGGKIVRQDYKVALMGENASVDLRGGWMLDKKNQAHANLMVEHQAENCRSSQFFKGVLQAQARSSFEGKIYVQPQAQKTEAYQLNKNLVLSDMATAYSKPNLEIFADDVKASHGSTIATLNQEELFYLQSRGLSKEKAKAMLTYGFCKEIINAVPLDSMKDRMDSHAKEF